MSEKELDPLNEVSVTLEYTIAEINALLNLLAQLPFSQVVGAINSVHVQVEPQIQKAKAGLDAVLKSTQKANDESQTTT